MHVRPVVLVDEVVLDLKRKGVQVTVHAIMRIRFCEYVLDCMVDFIIGATFVRS